MSKTLGTAGWLLGAGLLFLALLWLFQRRLIYLPFPSDVPPADLALPGSEEVVLRTEDGLVLNGWFLPGRGERSTTAVLVCNGNAGSRAYRAPLAEALARHGFSVLLFDYRGYADNPGRPSEEGLLRDARAARAWLAQRPGIERVAYFGESLGAAVAVALAAESPPAALILRSPFTSLADVGAHHYPFLPVRLLLRDRYPSIERIGRIGCPLLVIAGERDSIVPKRLSRRLFEAALEPKRWHVVPGADHNDLELLAGRELIAATVELLDGVGSARRAARAGPGLESARPAAPD